MGESDAQLVEAVFALREMGADSIPVNFLMPFDGTPLEGTWELSPLKALRILALVRFAAPSAEEDLAMIRDAGFHVLGQNPDAACSPEPAGSAGCCGGTCGTSDSESTPALRRRGAGTEAAPNA